MHFSKTLTILYFHILFISARLRGASSSSCSNDDILVFLDAHVEVGAGWLDPLVSAIRRNHSTVAVPHVDTIQADTLEYTPWVPEHYGSFTWDLQYEWRMVPGDSVPSIHQFPTATTIGCAFAVQYDYFYHIGAFDEQVINDVMILLG